MSHQDKFWDKFGKKIRQYRPEAYTDGDWDAMEQLLNDAGRPSRKVDVRLLAFALLALAIGYLSGAWYGFPLTPPELGAFPIPMEGIAREEGFNMEPTKAEGEASTLSPGEKAGRTRISDKPETIGTAMAPAHSGPVEPVEQITGMYASVSPEGHASENGKYQPEVADSPVKRVESSNDIFLAGENGPVKTLAPLPGYGFDVTDNRREEHHTAGHPTPRKKRAGFYAGFLLGGNLSMPRLQDAAYSFYPYGGFFAGIQLSLRWGVQAEAHLKYVGNLSIPYEQATKLESNNGFLFDQVSRGTAEKQYLALEFPVAASYQLHRQWSILAGVRPAFIFENTPAFGSEAQEDRAYNPSSSFGQGSSASEEGIAELRRFDLGLTAGLDWAFYRKWSLGLRFTRGLTDLSPNLSTGFSDKHFNSDFQVSVRRKF